MDVKSTCIKSSGKFLLKKEDTFLEWNFRSVYLKKIITFNFFIVKTKIRLIPLRLFIPFEIKLKLTVSSSDTVLLWTQDKQRLFTVYYKPRTNRDYLQYFLNQGQTETISVFSKSRTNRDYWLLQYFLNQGQSENISVLLQTGDKQRFLFCIFYAN